MLDLLEDTTGDANDVKYVGMPLLCNLGYQQIGIIYKISSSTLKQTWYQYNKQAFAHAFVYAHSCTHAMHVKPASLWLNCEHNEHAVQDS